MRKRYRTAAPSCDCVGAHQVQYSICVQLAMHEPNMKITDYSNQHVQP
jgi:hypothetical protein